MVAVDSNGGNDSDGDGPVVVEQNYDLFSLL